MAPRDVGPLEMRVILGAYNCRQGVIRFDDAKAGSISEDQLQ